VHVALKEIPRARLSSAGRLWQERDSLCEIARCRRQGVRVSPALTGLLECFITGHSICLVMDLVEGATLCEHRGAGIPLFKACWYAAEVAAALDWLHSHNWLYRDLKMSNVLISAQNGRVKIVDFGFAHRGVRATSVVGTLHAMAPEVIRCAGAEAQKSEAAYGCGADWWSLGVLLFEMLTAVPPFGYHEDVELEGHIMLEKQESIGADGLRWPGADPSAHQAVLALLEFDESRRAGTSGGLADLQDRCTLFAEVDWIAIASSGCGPSFDESLGHTVERAEARPRRPRRAALTLDTQLDSDTFAGFDLVI